MTSLSRLMWHGIVSFSFGDQRDMRAQQREVERMSPTIAGILTSLAILAVSLRIRRRTFKTHWPDFLLVGCPIEKDEFVRAVSSLLVGDVPLAPVTPVCHECKMLERDCLLIAKGLPCAGPVAAAGCSARCPGYGVPCIGCRGPVVEANMESLRDVLLEKGIADEDEVAAARLRVVALGSPPAGEDAVN